MKLPALRANIGNNTYYLTTLTFKQVSEYVSPINNELHKSKTLSELIQRSITSNYLGIKEYILNQEERFFNALILAVYDDYPDWREIQFSYDDIETYQMGILEFNSTHKIFPVDGQHRVEGIREALKENEMLATDQISVVFIGHQNTLEGLQKTRRLFSTLNRYAKPVDLNDIIALDEDDTVAIVTRRLLEDFDLFQNERISNSGNKAVPKEDKKALTSIITLFQCNECLLKKFINLKGKQLRKYRKFRPKESEIELFYDYCLRFWELFRDNITVIHEYSISTEDEPAQKYRNKQDGGNLLFRPKGLLPFVEAVLTLNSRTNDSLENILLKFNHYTLNISDNLWSSVLWNFNSQTMIMASKALVRNTLIYMYDEGSSMSSSEKDKLAKDYADKKSLTVEGDKKAILDLITQSKVLK